MSDHSELAALRQKIAELEQELDAVKQSEHRFQRMADNAPSVLFVIDLKDNRATYLNREQFLGYTLAEIEDIQTLSVFTHPDDLAIAGGIWQSALEHHTGEGIYRVRRKDGMWEWLSVKMTTLHDDEHEHSEVLVVMEPIGERLQMEQAMANAQQRFEVLSHAAGLVVYEYDVLAGHLEWSGELTNVLGYAPSEMNGGVDRWESRIHPDDHGYSMRLFVQAEELCGPYEVEYRFRHKNGSYVWLLDRGFFFGENGKATRMIGMMQDISARKAAEMDRLNMQEEIIRAQQDALRELNSPLIPVSDDTVVMPLIGTIDSRRAQDVMENLLQGIEQNHASVAIIDITGVPVVDTQVANALIQAAQAAQLLGAKVALTGIRPEVAQTLVGLGVDLSGILTLATLQSGIAYALRQRKT